MRLQLCEETLRLLEVGMKPEAVVLDVLLKVVLEELLEEVLAKSFRILVQPS